jgi:hypothetical protein
MFSHSSIDSERDGEVVAAKMIVYDGEDEEYLHLFPGVIASLKRLDNLQGKIWRGYKRS